MDKKTISLLNEVKTLGTSCDPFELEPEFNRYLFCINDEPWQLVKRLGESFGRIGQFSYRLVEWPREMVFGYRYEGLVGKPIYMFYRISTDIQGSPQRILELATSFGTKKSESGEELVLMGFDPEIVEDMLRKSLQQAFEAPPLQQLQ